MVLKNVELKNTHYDVYKKLYGPMKEYLEENVKKRFD